MNPKKQTRRKHKNSKLGCPNCKRRKIRCSEELPQCGNCIKHKEKCDYLLFSAEKLQELREAKLNKLKKTVQSVNVNLSLNHTILTNSVGGKPLSSVTTRIVPITRQSATVNTANANPIPLTRLDQESPLVSASQPFQTSLAHNASQPPSHHSIAIQSLHSNIAPQTSIHTSITPLDVNHHTLVQKSIPQTASFPHESVVSVILSAASIPISSHGHASHPTDANTNTMYAMEIAPAQPINHLKLKNDVNVDFNSFNQIFNNIEPKIYDNLYTNHTWNSNPHDTVSALNNDTHQIASDFIHENIFQYPNFNNRQATPFDAQLPNAIASPFSSINDYPQYITRAGSIDSIKHQQNLHDPSRHWLESNISGLLYNPYMTSSVLPHLFELLEGNEPIENNNSSVVIDSSIFPSNQFDLIGSKKLPNAIDVNMKFPILDYPTEDFTVSFEKTVGAAFKRMSLGKQRLPHFRELYISWLKQLIHRGTFSKLYFHCLMSLTINYLLCTRYNSSPEYRKMLNPSNNQVSHYQESDRTLKNVWEFKSINYFHPIIQQLRSMLGSHPDLSAQVSYILSLMAVYHHDASLASLNCFRDGLFSILNYNANTNTNDLQPLFFIPVYHRLVGNTVRSIYLPGYDISIIEEFQMILTEFYNDIKPLYSKHFFDFINLKLLDLIEFLRELLNVHIPIIQLNLDNLHVQEEELFKILYKWVRFYPSELISKKSTFTPLESITFLFYNSMKKVLFAIFPQIKFFFLRDFESPIMLDVFEFAPEDSYKLFNEELKDPVKNELSSQDYMGLLDKFRFISSYLIRISSYFRTRLSILYGILIKNSARFPISSFGSWSASIKSIDDCRQQFIQHTKIKETMITSFLNTVIQPEHYPQLESQIVAENISIKSETDPNTGKNIDFYTLTETGFLKVDFVPTLE